MIWRIQFVTLVFAMGLVMGSGIYIAEKGIQRIEGIADGPAQSFQVTQRGDGKMDMTVLGRSYSIEDETILPLLQSLPPLQDSQQETRSERFSWGNEIGHWVTYLSQKGLDWMTRF